MRKRFLTVEDLYQFCKTNKFSHFNSQQFGGPIILQSFEEIESINESNDGLCPVKLKACHIGRNANKSMISKASMEAALDSFKGRPILGSIIKLDSGEYDFHSHDMEITLGDNGETEIKYIEIPVGVTDQIAMPTLEFDDKEDKTYVMINGNIFEDYSQAADIMRRRRTAKCSVEIAVEEFSYDISEDAMSIDKFHFTGVTILGHEPDGTEIQEGMKGSKITIDSFCADNNGMLGANYQQKMIEVLDKLNTTLANFNKTDSKKEGGNEDMDDFVETVVDPIVNEDIEEIIVEDDSEIQDIDTPNNEESPQEDDTDKPEDEKFTRVFSIELSHDDIRRALYVLLDEQNTEECWYIREVFDSYFIAEDWANGKLYKQYYVVDDANVSLDGDKIEVFEIIVTADEKAALEALKESYAELQTQYGELVKYKEDIEAKQLKAQKDAIFARDAYSVLENNEEFKALVANADNLSVEEVEAKTKAIFADHIIQAGMFVAQQNDNSVPKTFGFNFEKSEEKRAYGDLFSK